MKVTSEQLLKLFGLKVGDKLHIEDIDFIVKKFINDELYLDNEGYCSSLMRLIDKDFEIIKQTPKLTEDEVRKLTTLKNKGFKKIFRSIYGDVTAILNEDDVELDVNLGSGFEPVQRNYDEPYNIEELLKGNELKEFNKCESYKDNNGTHTFKLK